MTVYIQAGSLHVLTLGPIIKGFERGFGGCLISQGNGGEYNFIICANTPEVNNNSHIQPDFDITHGMNNAPEV
jgi:hypothetical protein